MTFDKLMDRIDEEYGIHYRTYRDANGVEHADYEAACAYYGADTPVQLAAEARWEAAEEAIFHQDAMEARGGPLVGFDAYDDIPF